MAAKISELLALARDLEQRVRLEQLLQAIADRTSALLRTPRVSIRLFDPTQTRLLATCRAGKPLHQNASEYRFGEGLIGWIAEHVLPLRTDDAEADPRFVKRPDMVDRMGSFLGAPVVIDRSCIGVISAVNAQQRFFSEDDEELLQLVAALCAPRVELARLSRLAQLDTLTGAFNRRGLEQLFPDPPPNPTVTVAMVDIDHFKSINDDFGHASGDEVLKHVARLLSAVVRAEDSIVRLGGEEFLLVLPGIELNGAARIAERTRCTVEVTHFSGLPEGRRVTISVGVAQLKPLESRDAAIARADAALYRAKSSGRNRVELATD